MRIEEDSLGKVQLPSDCLYGIQTLRATQNFPIGSNKVHKDLIEGFIQVKKAAAMAHQLVGTYDQAISALIIKACDDLLVDYPEGQFVTSAIQGGAGTSINMNVNEVIANKALIIGGHTPGMYQNIDPLTHVNKSQSTNDVFPTALRIASILKLRQVSESFAKLQEAFQEKESLYADVIKLGRTQLMDALPIMMGQSFGAFAQAVARDRWRLYKVEERLRQINLGGTGIGTGLNAPQKYIFAVTEFIRQNTGIGLARAEFPIDLTQNQDVFVEVAGLLKAAAVNLMKIANDLRLMNSGPRGGLGEISLEPLQAGSSIMPGKVNPIIPEAVVSGCIKVIANDLSITTAATMGSFELNPFLPTIADSLLESLDILLDLTELFRVKCIDTLTVNEDRCKELLDGSTAMVTALSEHIGYDKAGEIAKEMHVTGKDIRTLVLEQGLLSKDSLESILNPYAVTKPGIPGL